MHYCGCKFPQNILGKVVLNIRYMRGIFCVCMSCCGCNSLVLTSARSCSLLVNSSFGRKQFLWSQHTANRVCSGNFSPSYFTTSVQTTKPLACCKSWWTRVGWFTKAYGSLQLANSGFCFPWFFGHLCSSGILVLVDLDGWPSNDEEFLIKGLTIIYAATYIFAWIYNLHPPRTSWYGWEQEQR